ncbi:putative porin [Hydrocarboniphaga sp.]|uniref:putative porin n=1 Tax=Hydrocarboniphaga sp. TaxID=2033016 RepID=UPI003D0DB612
MTSFSRHARRAMPLTLLAAAAAAYGRAAVAQDLPEPPPQPEAPAPKETVTEELIRMLQMSKVLAPEDAERLIGRLRSEQAPATAAAPAEPKGRVRVPYIPESEKQKIRDEIRDGMIATAKIENWAQPNTFPDWVKRVKIGGDIRLREEFDFLDSSNDPFLINFQSINSGSPYNVGTPLANQVSPPLINTTEDREAFRVRARLDVSGTISDEVKSVFRFTTGNNTNPVSTNQTLGNSFNKLSFVIDRAYLTYKPEDLPLAGLVMWGGRMPSPFQGTELTWDEDLNFDGLAATYKARAGGGVWPFLTLGGFSVQNTAFDFPATAADKSASRDRWLLAAQLGADWTIQPEMVLSGAVAYYDYIDLEGKTSSECLAPTTSFSCDTDDSRPAFLQKGNTLYAIRNLQLAAAGDPEYQYFGLATPYRLLDANIKFDWAVAGPIHLMFDADYVRNLAYDKNDVLGKVPVNNYGAGLDTDGDGVEDIAGAYKGGDTGYLAQLRVGYPVIRMRGEWSVGGGYRRIESDAVVDAFNDSDFHLGGSNAKGFVLGGSLGVSKNAWITGRYFSATEVSGPPLAIDVLQLDLNARF